VRIEWLPVAVANSESQIDYIAERDPRAALAMGEAIGAAIRDLADYPKIGRPGRVPGSRELVVRGTPYVIAYRLEPGCVVVVRLMHGAQHWPDKL
jgi:toxin ParE1/3/4